MPRIMLRLTTLIAVFALACATPAVEHNTLTEAERSDGWKLLFDGETFDNWSGIDGTALPTANWEIKDAVLQTIPGHGRDLVSTQEYNDFELSFDVKILADGNNGVKYFVQQDLSAGQPRGAIGHEYQVLDDATLDNMPGWERHSMGSFYLVYAPDKNKKQSPFGEWNRCRIVVKGQQVEHWLNGDKILEYELGTEDLLARVQETKFRDEPGFGMKTSGYIVLTHHSSPAWYRNIKIRELD